MDNISRLLVRVACKWENEAGEGLWRVGRRGKSSVVGNFQVFRGLSGLSQFSNGGTALAHGFKTTSPIARGLNGLSKSRSSGVVSTFGIRWRRHGGNGTVISPVYQRQQIRFHGDDHVDPNAKTVRITFIRKDDTEKTVEGKVGQNLLRLAQKNAIELEGACECSLACSTCHVILEPEVFDELDEPCEDEEDMLDQAFGLTETSRLGCQIEVAEYMEGTKITLPKATRNFYVDGHVPQPH